MHRERCSSSSLLKPSLTFASISVPFMIIHQHPSSTQSSTAPPSGFVVRLQRSDSVVCMCLVFNSHHLPKISVVLAHTCLFFVAQCSILPFHQQFVNFLSQSLSSFSVAIKLQRSESQVCVYSSQLAENILILSFLVNRHCRRTSLA